MKRLKQFDYFEPTSIKEASEILVEKGDQAYPLAGGTDLLVRMKRGAVRPGAIVNLKRIKHLDQIKENGKDTLLGALVSISDIEKSSVIRENHPVLAQAAGLLGAQSIRNIATIGGNIGRASPASDMSPALMVLQARIGIEGPAGKREMDIDKIFTGPGTTNLATGEIISAFILPGMAPNTGAAYLKLGRRSGGGDCALVGVAVLLTLGNDGVREVRIAMSSVGPRPLRAKKAEEMILSGPLNEERMREAARAAASETNPITDMRCSASYRQEMIRVLTYRALDQALGYVQGGK